MSQLERTLREKEHEIVAEALAANGGHRAKTAAALGIHIRTLFRKIEEMRAAGIPAANTYQRAREEGANHGT